MFEGCNQQVFNNITSKETDNLLLFITSCNLVEKITFNDL